MDSNDSEKVFQDLTDVESSREYSVVSLAFDISNALGKILDRKGWTQARLAQEMGVSRSYVSQVLSAQQNMSIRKIAEICHTLGEDPRLLFGLPAPKIRPLARRSSQERAHKKPSKVN